MSTLIAVPDGHPPKNITRPPRRGHRLITGVQAGELEREVTLDRRREISLAALIERPASVGALNIEQVLLQARLRLDIDRVHEVIEDDELRVHLGVGFECRLPVALRVLLRDQGLLGTSDRMIELRAEFVTWRNCRSRQAISYV